MDMFLLSEMNLLMIWVFRSNDTWISHHSLQWILSNTLLQLLSPNIYNGESFLGRVNTVETNKEIINIETK